MAGSWQRREQVGHHCHRRFLARSSREAIYELTIAVYDPDGRPPGKLEGYVRASYSRGG